MYERQQRHAKPRRPRRVIAGLLSLVLPVALTLAAAVPLEARADATQVGKASWYGPGLHGKKTASGERFNPQRLTAAHRRLPLGTQARVTNLKNGKAVTVIINDRGPHRGGRIIDLSRAAAERLSMGGVARVRVEVLN